jgi:hypothetical protein
MVCVFFSPSHPKSTYLCVEVESKMWVCCPFSLSEFMHAPEVWLLCGAECNFMLTEPYLIWCSANIVFSSSAEKWEFLKGKILITSDFDLHEI